MATAAGGLEELLPVGLVAVRKSLEAKRPGVLFLLLAVPLICLAVLALYFAAMLALMGLPPFGLFVSEVMIFGAGFAAGHVAVSVVALGLVVIAFAGLLRALQRMLYGEAGGRGVERVWTAAPFVVALGLLLMTGLVWPPGLAGALAGIASVIAP